MPEWPWSKDDRDWFAARLRAKQHIPDALSRRFLRQLATGTLNPQPDCRVPLCRRGTPVENLRAWAGMHRSDALAAHVRTAEDDVYVLARRRSRWAVWLFARRLVGWKQRRGDIVLMRVRRKPWKGMRVK